MRLRDFQSNGPTLICTSRASPDSPGFPFPPKPGFHGTNTIRSSLSKGYMGLSCQVGGILEGRVIPDTCSSKWILPLPSRTSVLAGSLQPGDEKLVLKSVHVGPVTTWVQANRLPLGRTALLINHALGKRVVCPRLHFAVTKPV